MTSSYINYGNIFDKNKHINIFQHFQQDKIK
jgi:hypothetical protein